MRPNGDEVKAHIYEYYRTQNKSIEELPQLMRKHGLHRSRRWYLDKIVLWGYEKNVRRKIRPKRSAAVENAAIVHTPSIHTVVESTRNSNFSLAPRVSPLWNDAETPWPTTAFLEISLQDTLGHSYEADQNSQTTVPANGFGSITYQSPQAEEALEDTPDIDGRTLLHHAAIEGNMERVRVLLSTGYSLQRTDDSGNQPLHYVAQEIRVGIIELMLRNGADVNARGAEGKTPLHLASRSVKAVRLLLKKHPNLSIQDDEGNTALHTAFNIGFDGSTSFRVVKSLIQSGSNVNVRNNSGVTPFHMALDVRTLKNEVDCVLLALFLKNNVDVSIPTTKNESPFKVFLDTVDSYWHGNQPVSHLCKLFLHCGADPNTVLKGGLSFFHQIFEKHMYRVYEAILKTLCETVDINRILDSGGSPLHVCARYALYDLSRQCIDILLRRGARLDQLNSTGDSPLMVLLRPQPYFTYDPVKLVSIMKSFLQAGADPMRRHGNGDVPVYHAFRFFESKPYRPNIIKVLVDSYVAGDDSIEESAVFQHDHLWWSSYRRLRQQKSWSPSMCLLGSAVGLPDDIGKELAHILLTQAAEEILASASVELSKSESAAGLASSLKRAHQECMVRVLRDCSQMKLDIDPSWYHRPLEFFDS